MKLGVMMALFGGRSLKEAVAMLRKIGVEMVELCAGNYPGTPHFDVGELLKSKRKCDELKSLLADNGLEISALSCHGNPIHPNKEYAKANAGAQRKAIRLAEKLGVGVVCDFSGCPGDSDKAKYPNWVTCPWPPDFLEIVTWQWEKKVIPHWQKTAKFAADHGVKMALEMHPGFVVYNPETLLKLRDAAGKNIGANFDPSHLFWQGIDPIAAIRQLKGVIFHVHAKDTRVDPINAGVNGVLDTKPYSDEEHRSWIFRTVGYGHSYQFWCDFVSMLRTTGYDYVLSIEHEDSLMSVTEGLTKAATFLKQVLVKEKSGAMWWA
jgi:sugar phosphate isomerase/epimerase